MNAGSLHSFKYILPAHGIIFLYLFNLKAGLYVSDSMQFVDNLIGTGWILDL